LQWPDGWPRARQRAPSRFTTGYVAAWDNLQSQLRLLGASDVVVSSNAPISARTGRPYAEAMGDYSPDPGVAVWFTFKGRPRVMARDGHPTPAENLHSIGHVIEAMRAIERNGGGYMMERSLDAFVSLPSPERRWWDVLGISADAKPDQIEAAYRSLAKQHHPDHGGTAEAMADLNKARDEARRAALQ
jgi:hypothetical protein